MLTVNATSNTDATCITLSEIVALLEHANFGLSSDENGDNIGSLKAHLILTDDPSEPGKALLHLNLFTELLQKD